MLLLFYCHKNSDMCILYTKGVDSMNFIKEIKQDDTDARVKAAKRKKAEASYMPTLQEVFVTGWINPKTGKKKNSIASLKNSDADKAKIKAVYEALNSGELGLDGIPTNKLTKTTVLSVLYPQLVAIRKEEMIHHLIETAPKNYHLVNTESALHHMVTTIEKEPAIAVDTETTGVTHDDCIVGYSISCPIANEHFYVPFRHTTGEQMLPADVCLSVIKPVLEDPKVLKVLHNVKFDHEKFLFDKYSISMVNFVDTMVLMYVLNENEESYALKKLATKYGKHFGFNEKSDTYEELFGKGGFENTPIKVGYIYACKDTHLTWSLYQWQLEHLKKQPKLWHIAFDIEMPLIPVLLKMHYRGFNLDMEYAENYKTELQEQITGMEQQLAEYFPNINLNSNQQLAEYLYGTLKLSNNHNGSVDKEALNELADEYEGVKILLDYRKLTKLLSTYIEPLPQKVWSDGFLHGEINQMGTKTGRLASENPNLQNIPPAARKIFVAPEGKLYMSCDFSKMEIFIACELSGDPNLYDALHSGADVYSVIASKSYGLPIEQCGDGTVYRKHAKTALLGCMYGALPFTIAKQVNVSVEEGKEILDNFFNGNPVLTAQIHKCHDLVAKQGYVETLQGRKRRFPEIPAKVKLLNKLDQMIKQKTGKTGTQWDKELDGIYKAKKIPYDLRSKWYSLNKEIQRAYRQSFNATDQGSGGDICKIALINLDRYFSELNKDLPPEKHYHIVSTIHDEQLIEVPEDIPMEVIKQIEYIMCHTIPLHVTMRTDNEFYKRYYHDGKSSEQIISGDLPQA